LGRREAQSEGSAKGIRGNGKSHDRLRFCSNHARKGMPPVQLTAFPPAAEPPTAVLILLAAVAGFVDACTFFGLFGFFVAQVTGSYVLVGTHAAAGWPGIVTLLAVPVFFAGSVAATLAAIAGQALARRPLTAALMLETLLLVVFAATFSAARTGAADTSAVAAASLFGLAAMGAQSALVRLLMRGAGSTNVMTTATTQIAIDATQVAWQLAWAWLRRTALLPEAIDRVEAARARLGRTVPVPLAFFVGTMAGAVGFTRVGHPVLAAPVAVVGALAWWAGRRERGPR
jgi:uncharacterized membrane protein YoaK (UPF0700 family)